MPGPGSLDTMSAVCRLLCQLSEWGGKRTISDPCQVLNVYGVRACVLMMVYLQRRARFLFLGVFLQDIQ